VIFLWFYGFTDSGQTHHRGTEIAQRNGDYFVSLCDLCASVVDIVFRKVLPDKSEPI